MMSSKNKKPSHAQRTKKRGRTSRQTSTEQFIPTTRAVTAPSTRERAGTARSDSSDSLREKLGKIVDLSSVDPEEAKRFAGKLKALSKQICALHLQQKALFHFKWDYIEPLGSASFSEDFAAAHNAMEELESEIHLAVERQRSLIADLELRATLLQAKLGFRGTLVPRG
jgi:hypothetical protein